METSKERFDRTMEEVKAAKMNGLPQNSEVDEVEKTAASMREEQPRKSHLTAEEKSALTHLLKSYSEQKVSDPVLLHLLKMRESSKRDYLEKQNAMKAIYMGVMKELGDLSQEMLKLQGAIESTDRQIIEFLKEQQDGGNPPAA